jgi:hypothetical protein
VLQRHNIFVRRFVRNEEPPWTDDPILEKYSFTNVYSELDKGTVWAKENIVSPNQDDEQNMLFQAIAYRCLPNIQVGLPLVSTSSASL